MTDILDPDDRLTHLIPLDRDDSHLDLDLVEFTIKIFFETCNSLLKLALSQFYCEFLGTDKSNYRDLNRQ